MGSSDQRADVILRALGGQIDGFLPGQDTRAAVARAAAGRRRWRHERPDGRVGYGQVTRRGIGEWLTWARSPKPAEAAVFVTWPQVLGVIACGCEGGRRETYEAAYRRWAVQAGRVGGSYADATAAAGAAREIVDHGCSAAGRRDRPAVQAALF